MVLQIGKKKEESRSLFGFLKNLFVRKKQLPFFSFFSVNIREEKLRGRKRKGKFQRDERYPGDIGGPCGYHTEHPTAKTSC